MTLINRICRVPLRLDHKTVFTELNYLFSYLKHEKTFIKRTLAFVSSLERFYRSASQSFTSDVEPKSQIPTDLPYTSGLLQFRQTRLKFASRFLEIAQRITLVNGDLTRIRNEFNVCNRRLKTDLKSLQSGLQSPLENLLTSIAGSYKYFKQVLQTQATPQQAFKAIRALDDKLLRVHNSYLVFHRAFVEYCSIREPIFVSLEITFRKTNGLINETLDLVTGSDKIVLRDLEMASIQDDTMEVSGPELQGQEEEEVGENHPVFMVRIGQPVSLDGVMLQVNTQLSVVEAKGRIWKLRDESRDCFWSIPQIYLKPEEKTK